MQYFYTYVQAGTVSTLSENVLKKKNLKSKTTYYCFYYYDGYDDYEVRILLNCTAT
jgi:hypothetical protein